jgi:hypothetical protein
MPSPVALAPTLGVEQVPVALVSQTRTLYGDDLRAWLGDNLPNLNQEPCQIEARDEE